MTLPPGPDLPTPLLLAHWFHRPYPFLDECARRFGDAFTIRLPSMPPAVVYHHPDVIKEMFSQGPEDVHAGEANRVLRPFLGKYSLLVLDGAEHIRQRKLLLPPFHGERMASYGARIIDVTERSLARWPERRRFPVHTHLQAITMDIILRIVFGLEDEAALAPMRERLVAILDQGSIPWLLVPAFQRDLGPWSPWGKFVRAVQSADELLYAEIRRRRAEGAQGRDDVLSLLLDVRDEDGKPMSDEELRDELVTLLVAGHETTATSLSWALRWILDNPAFEARLLRELSEGEPTPERLGKLPLLDAAVRETLRLQPVVPMVGRVLQRPMRVGAHDLDRGTPVLLSIYLTQRRPDLYPDPKRFDPDRFLRHKYGPSEWLPFGGGIRRCLGMAFALYEMKMVLGTVLSRAALRLPLFGRVREVRRSITIAPSRGMPLVLERRLHPKAPAPSAPQPTTAASL
jgi:cytochrome P450